MTHRFPIKDIAQQSGLSVATVDRVLNARSHVSAQSRARVQAAMAELQAQELLLAARGRRVMVDILVEAPERFSREIRAAATRAAGQFGGAVLRPRFEMHEVMRGPQVAAVLDRIGRRGSAGLLLKARDVPQVRAAVDRLAARGIPVVTLVTDLPGTARRAYVGLDNAAAGRTAAWLITRFAGATARGTVLASLSDPDFTGEGARLRAFRAALATRAPGLCLRVVSGGGGLNAATAQRVGAALAGGDEVIAVYSMGGGNRAILSALHAQGRDPGLFVAHDLDSDNRGLLAAGRIDIVLHHDLDSDLRRAFGHILDARRVLPSSALDRVLAQHSAISVITPANLPDPSP